MGIAGGLDTEHSRPVDCYRLRDIGSDLTQGVIRLTNQCRCHRHAAGKTVRKGAAIGVVDPLESGAVIHFDAVGSTGVINRQSHNKVITAHHGLLLGVARGANEFVGKQAFVICGAGLQTRHDGDGQDAQHDDHGDEFDEREAAILIWSMGQRDLFGAHP